MTMRRARTRVYQERPGIAGVVLMSGRYHFDPKPDDPNLKNFQAYFGADDTKATCNSSKSANLGLKWIQVSTFRPRKPGPRSARGRLPVVVLMRGWES